MTVELLTACWFGGAIVMGGVGIGGAWPKNAWEAAVIVAMVVCWPATVVAYILRDEKAEEPKT